MGQAIAKRKGRSREGNFPEPVSSISHRSLGGYGKCR